VWILRRANDRVAKTNWAPVRGGQEGLHHPLVARHGPGVRELLRAVDEPGPKALASLKTVFDTDPTEEISAVLAVKELRPQMVQAHGPNGRHIRCYVMTGPRGGSAPTTDSLNRACLGETGPGRRSLSRARSSAGNRRYRAPPKATVSDRHPSPGDTSSDTSPIDTQHVAYISTVTTGLVLDERRHGAYT